MTTTIDLDAVLEGRRLLEHPFYRRWEAGELSRDELAAYAAQYAHFERQLPVTLEALATVAAPGAVRDAVEANLADERGNPQAHVELLASFCDAVGAIETPATPATAALVALYDGATSRSVGFALGVLGAYESQAADVAATKGDGLRAHYGLDATGTRFWDVHATMERDHAEWTLGAAADVVDADEVVAGLAASRDAWWAFLDEREAVAA
jgi:pyrroloquinoline-quinone synthase